jgi:ATP-binding cassette subfamily B protein/ATP-binding cassette subfamily C protein LapB
MDKLAPFLRRHISSFIDLLLCALVINFFVLLTPLFSSFVYDKILGNGITDTLWALVIGIIIAFLIEFCVRMIRVTMADRFAIISDNEIDNTVFQNLINTNTNKLPGIGVLIEKYKQMTASRDFLSSSYLLSVADIPFLLLFLMVIAYVSGPLVLVPIICGALVLGVSLFLMPFEMESFRQAKKTSEERLSLMADVLISRDAVTGSFFRDHLKAIWKQKSLDTAVLSSRARFWRGLSLNSLGFIAQISFVAVMVGGVYMVEARALTSGGLLAVSMITSRAMSSVSSLAMLILRYREFKISMQEMNQMLPDTGETAASVSYGRLTGDIKIDHITCRLAADEKPVLVTQKIEIKGGHLVGVAGAPGAGKSTLLRLIAGVLQPDEGAILIDNIPVLKLSHQDIGVNIGFKPQELCLMEGTIEDNIRAGSTQVTAQDLQDVLEKSGLLLAFKETGLNWKTQAGARGCRLSGGQRQLVALARAMLSKPTILLLDEPTNGLDAPLEAHLVRQLEDMRGKSTVLVCTHSRSILSICDQIIVIGNGRILADGPREKILVQ